MTSGHIAFIVQHQHEHLFFKSHSYSGWKHWNWRLGGDTEKDAAAGSCHTQVRSRREHTVRANKAKLNLQQQGVFHSQFPPLKQEITIKKEEGIKAELLTVQLFLQQSR